MGFLGLPERMTVLFDHLLLAPLRLPKKLTLFKGVADKQDIGRIPIEWDVRCSELAESGSCGVCRNLEAGFRIPKRSESSTENDTAILFDGYPLLAVLLHSFRAEHYPEHGRSMRGNRGFLKSVCIHEKPLLWNYIAHTLFFFEIKSKSPAEGGTTD